MQLQREPQQCRLELLPVLRALGRRHLLLRERHLYVPRSKLRLCGLRLELELQLVQPGSVLGGKYRLIRQLDRGGMGAVWEAQHLTLGAAVAVKLMDMQIGASEDSMKRFLREAQAAAALRSPHVVQILDYGIDSGVPYIVMELLEGESLAARLERQPLSPQQTA